MSGVVSGAAEESAGDEAEAEGGRAEQTLVHDVDDPQPHQRQDEERPVTLSYQQGKLGIKKTLLGL